MKNRLQKLAILGAGAFAEEVADLAADSGLYELVRFIEGIDREKCRRPLMGKPVVWIEDVAPWAKECQVICAVGTPKRINFIQQAMAQGLSFTTLIHPSANVATSVVLGVGTIVGAGVVIGAQTKIGRHVIINRGCLIGHHLQIKDYATISPGANLAGGVQIAEGVQVGMGAIVLDHLGVGRGAVVGAGAVVTRAVPEHVQVVGVPARIVKELEPFGKQE